ncbi:SCP2 sterol-binding domain-containing protein [Marinospirillum sp. MEB164]|uniref:SCP2 sterol-binding domain-containing protein n=1 Tax=Marinospirillum alkalitolerans TaxID=3123374 RepID=A0ABW8PWF7_9GAMM
MALPLSALVTFESLLNPLLNQLKQESLLAEQTWQQLNGRVLRCEVQPLGWSLVLVFSDEGLSLLRETEADIDAWISASPFAYLALLQGRSAQVEMGGETALFELLQDLWQQLGQEAQQQVLVQLHRWPLAGPVIAQGGAWLKSLIGLGQRATQAAQRDLNLYVADEAGLLMNSDQLHVAEEGLFALRQELERLEAKVQRLEGQLAAQPLSMKDQGAN